MPIYSSPIPRFIEKEFRTLQNLGTSLASLHRKTTFNQIEYSLLMSWLMKILFAANEIIDVTRYYLLFN